MFWDRKEKKMMVENARRRGGVWLPTRALEKSGTHSTEERSSTELRFASFRARLWVTWGAVKGQDERPLRGALDSPASHHRTSMLTSENKLRRAATSALTFMTFS